MPYYARPIIISLVLASAMAGGSTRLNSSTRPGSGTLAVELANGSFMAEGARYAEVFVVRVDVRRAAADSASAARVVPDDSAGSEGWVTIAAPNARVNLLDYQYRVTLPLGNATIAAGTYKGLRLIIDPSRSRLSFAGDTTQTMAVVPQENAPDLAHVGLGIFLVQPLTIVAHQTTTLRVDFAIDDSFALRGETIDGKGFVTNPVLRGTTKP